MLWTNDLMEEYGSKTFDRGYASSPVLYRYLVIFPLSGPDKAFIAFRQKDGPAGKGKQTGLHRWSFKRADSTNW